MVSSTPQWICAFCFCYSVTLVIFELKLPVCHYYTTVTFYTTLSVTTLSVNFYYIFGYSIIFWIVITLSVRFTIIGCNMGYFIDAIWAFLKYRRQIKFRWPEPPNDQQLIKNYALALCDKNLNWTEQWFQQWMKMSCNKLNDL